MNEKVDPVIKLAQYQPPCAALPKGWHARRLDQGEIVISCPGGVLPLNGNDAYVSLAARLLYNLVNDVLNEQRKAS